MALPSKNRRKYWHERQWIFIAIAIATCLAATYAIEPPVVLWNSHSAFDIELVWTPSDRFDAFEIGALCLLWLPSILAAYLLLRAHFPAQDPSIPTKRYTSLASPVLRAGLVIAPAALLFTMLTGIRGGSLLLSLALGVTLLARNRQLLAGLCFGLAAAAWPAAAITLLCWLGIGRRLWMACLGVLVTTAMWVASAYYFEGVVYNPIEELAASYHAIINLNPAAIATAPLAIIAIVAAVGVRTFRVWPHIPTAWRVTEEPWSGTRTRRFSYQNTEQPQQGVIRELALALALAVVISPSSAATVVAGLLLLLAASRELEMHRANPSPAPRFGWLILAAIGLLIPFQVHAEQFYAGQEWLFTAPTQIAYLASALWLSRYLNRIIFAPSQS